MKQLNKISADDAKAWTNMSVIQKAILITWLGWPYENREGCSFWRYDLICKSALKKLSHATDKKARGFPEYDAVREYFLSKWLKGGAK